MALANHAIVVGVQSYPELPPRLQGPVNDARAFHEWVTTKGGVKRDNAKLILSAPPKRNVRAYDAQPSVDAVGREFDKLDDIGNTNIREGRERIVGQRLYLYFAGHGFGSKVADAALLMANATPRNLRHNIPGRPWANRFLLSGLFDEVLLFMDCCRERYSGALNLPDDAFDFDAVDRGRIFLAFAAKYSRLAVERRINGKMRGVFSATLLQGLEDAAEPDGRITAASLGSYLYTNMKKNLKKPDLENPDVAQEPDIQYDPNTANAFVIAKVPPKVYPVVIALSPRWRGQEVQVRDGKFEVVHKVVARGSQLRFTLGRGTYLVQLAGTTTEAVVEVTGIGVTHATL